MVQNHVAQRINLLDRIPVVAPHVVDFGEMVRHKFIGRIVRPEVRLPVWVQVETTLSYRLPFRNMRFGAGTAHGDMVQYWRYPIFVRSRAELVDAVVGKGNVEVVVLRRE